MTADERAALRALAELLGGLLLRELESADLVRLRRPDLVEALAGVGIQLPEQAEEDDWLEERAAEYHEFFLRPDSGPLVQSLWTEGRYEGDSTVRIRQLAEHAGVEFQREAARGAAPDHLGSILLLWAATEDRVPAVAEALLAEHLGWCEAPLAKIASVDGFYGAVGAATAELVRSLTEQQPA